MDGKMNSAAATINAPVTRNRVRDGMRRVLNRIRGVMPANSSAAANSSGGAMEVDVPPSSISPASSTASLVTSAQPSVTTKCTISPAGSVTGSIASGTSNATTRASNDSGISSDGYASLPELPTMDISFHEFNIAFLESSNESGGSVISIKDQSEEAMSESRRPAPSNPFLERHRRLTVNALRQQPELLDSDDDSDTTEEHPDLQMSRVEEGSRPSSPSAAQIPSEVLPNSRVEKVQSLNLSIPSEQQRMALDLIAQSQQHLNAFGPIVHSRNQSLILDHSSQQILEQPPTQRQEQQLLDVSNQNSAMSIQSQESIQPATDQFCQPMQEQIQFLGHLSAESRGQLMSASSSNSTIEIAEEMDDSHMSDYEDENNCFVAGDMYSQNPQQVDDNYNEERNEFEMDDDENANDAFAVNMFPGNPQLAGDDYDIDGDELDLSDEDCEDAEVFYDDGDDDYEDEDDDDDEEDGDDYYIDDGNNGDLMLNFDVADNGGMADFGGSGNMQPMGQEELMALIAATAMQNQQVQQSMNFGDPQQQPDGMGNGLMLMGEEEDDEFEYEDEYGEDDVYGEDYQDEAFSGGNVGGMFGDSGENPMIIVGGGMFGGNENEGNYGGDQQMFDDYGSGESYDGAEQMYEFDEYEEESAMEINFDGNNHVELMNGDDYDMSDPDIDDDDMYEDDEYMTGDEQPGQWQGADQISDNSIQVAAGNEVNI